MKQLGLSATLFIKQTRRQQFLHDLEPVVPWDLCEGRIRLHYPTAKRSRRPFALATILRIQLLEQRFDYFDLAALHDMPVLREFAFSYDEK